MSGRAFSTWRELPAVALFTLLSVTSLPVVAQETVTLWSTDGDVYLGILNDSGAALTSKYPKAWFHGEPWEEHTVTEQTATIFLGKSCDALHSEYGAGTWDWSNDNFSAVFGQRRVSFANQELFAHGRFAECEE